eukprot:6456641-Amphidinium_carterae.1
MLRNGKNNMFEHFVISACANSTSTSKGLLVKTTRHTRIKVAQDDVPHNGITREVVLGCVKAFESCRWNERFAIHKRILNGVP